MATTLEGSGLQGNPYASGQTDTGSASLTEAGKEQAKRLSGAGREKALQQVEGRKGQLADSLRGLVSTLESASGSAQEGLPRQFLDRATGVVRDVADRIENNSTEDLLRQAKDGVRSRPGLFLAGCLALGFFAGRLVRD